MGLMVRQWRHWRQSTAMLWLAERQCEWEKLAVVAWLCGAVTLAVMLRWSLLVSTVWLHGDVRFSLGK
jgi:hypothetical protein